MMMRWLCLLIAFLPLSLQALTLTDRQSRYEAAPYLQWLDDPRHTLQPRAALSALQNGQGTPITQPYPSLGFRKGFQWLLLNIDNASSQTQWLARISRPHLDSLDVYLFDSDGALISHDMLGDKHAFTERSYPHHLLVVPLTLKPEQSHYLLMRARSDNIIEFPLLITSPSAFSQDNNKSMMLQGLYYGAIVAMCLFNLLIFISIRDKGYLLYVLYLGLFALNLFTRDGLSFQWLWPDAPLWNHYSLSFLNLFALAFAQLFTTQFLELKQRAPRIHKAIVISSIAMIVLSPLTLINFSLSLQITTALVLPWPIIAISLSIWLIMQGYSPARYFLLAFITVATTTAIYTLKTFQVIESGWYMENIMQLGTFLEGLLLSFALAHRMTLLKSENARIQREATEALEQRVDERTQELNSALNARSEFLAVMSHEIRTPLNGIIGTVDMLKDSKLDREQRNSLNVIEQSGNSLLNLINDILDYSRIEAGKMPIEQTRFDLRTLSHETVSLFKHKAAQMGNTLRCEFADNLGALCVGDPVRLRQILSNLISNAVKFTDSGHITLKAKRDPENLDYVYIEVVDSGIGISAEQLNRLFDFFQQGDSSTSRRYGGTGLGLAICRQLVEIMGGEIGVQSRRNAGSTFWFRLPLPCADGSGLPLPIEQPDDDIPISSGHLLIVDDNHINLMVAQGLCQKLGFTTDVAESGMEAIAVLMSSEKPFDLILMDCEMPEMDGFETTRAIVKLQDEGRVPVIPILALTAHAVPDKIHACHDAGMVGHIAKPVTLAQLQKSLNRTLRRY